MKKLIIIVSVALFISACSEDAETISDTPVISFNSIYPAVVKEFSDKFYIEIAYKDGNGNIGTLNPDETNLTVTDSRNGLEYNYRVRDLSTPKGDPAIKGVLVIEMPPTAVLDDSNAFEETSFKVVLTDDSGERSNEVTTAKIKIEK